MNKQGAARPFSGAGQVGTLSRVLSCSAVLFLHLGP